MSEEDLSSSGKSRTSSADDSPSSSTTNEHGQELVNDRLRSCLSHHLGLPLIYMLHGRDPRKLKHLAQESEFHSIKESNARSLTDFDNIFSEAVNEWGRGEGKRNEPALIRLLGAKLEGESGKLGFHSVQETTVNCSDDIDNKRRGPERKRPMPRIHLLLTSDLSEGCTSQVPSMPVAILKVGRTHSLWWKKLDQNLHYIDNMGAKQRDARLRHEQPLLSIVLTIEGGEDGSEWDVKLGVFFCERREVRDRIMLLWRIHAKTLGQASQAFGNVLRATSDFRRWREYDAKSGTLDTVYERLGPNCCRVDDCVLRSYDSRFRRTDRSPEIYLDEKCQDILGGVVTRVLELPIGSTLFGSSQNASSNSSPYVRFWSTKFRDETFWEESTERGLLVIATPYLRGGHEARKLASFVPVISQLEALHSKGFVHGDIRGFNVVFGTRDDKEEGWLIDFDFGGTRGRKYPKGYRNALADGDRFGDEKGEDEILPWHDWYALGTLLFRIHAMCPLVERNPAARHGFQYFRKGVNNGLTAEEQWEVKQWRMAHFWSLIIKEPTSEEIAGLKEFLYRLDEHGWTVFPRPGFERQLLLNTG